MAANSRDALLRPSVSATAQLEAALRNSGATAELVKASNLPMTGSELRAQLLAQRERNSQLHPGGREPAGVAPTAEAGAANRGAHYLWRVTLSDGTPFQVRCLPETTAAEMALLYRGVTVSPLRDAPDSLSRPATQIECAELANLIAVVLPGDEDGQHEALPIALADVDNALVCYRALAKEMLR